MPRRKALITGASGGIGLELAKLFAADDHDLVIVARSGPKLEELAAQFRAQYGVEVQTVALDLSMPSAAQTLFNQVGTCDVLVNNAGFATYGKFVDNPWEEQYGELQLNVVTLTELTRLFVPGMIAQRWGRVLNVASTAAFQPGPLMAIYYATKAYVLSFSEAIENELKDTGVTVTCLCPGATDTGFQARANMENVRLFSVAVADAASVAKAGYDGLMHGKSVVIPGFKNKALAFSTRLTPRKLVTKISRAVVEQSK
ncbi:MAG: SDR family oxidoreductase [Candidatus Eremiobacteraeota bacterium]|nr:SDR family oxidoreductase [Candidatus Eremiobacteraeota bacterium]